MSFYLLSGILLSSALLVVTLKNIFHCALFLILALLALAGLYFNLGAPFLAVLQLVIYVGAIVILIIFAIMLTSRLSDKILRAANQQAWPALLLVLCWLALVAPVLVQTSFPQNVGQPFDPLFGLGLELLTTYLLPFEVISLILLVALVGAMVLAKKD